MTEHKSSDLNSEQPEGAEGTVVVPTPEASEHGLKRNFSDAPSRASARSSRGIPIIAGLTLLLACAVAGVAYWQHQRIQALEQAAQSTLQQGLEQALTRQQQLLDQYSDSFDTRLQQYDQGLQEQLRQANGQLQQGRTEQQELLAQVEGRMATVDGQQARISALQARMDALVERLEALRQIQQPSVKLRWQAVLDLLAVGRAQALQLHRPEQGLRHYQAARQLLLEQADSDSAQVISLIDEEIRRLQAQPKRDLTELSAQIEAQLDQLPLWQPAQAAPKDALPEAAGWWDKLTYYLRKPFTLRRAEALDEIDVAVLRQALHLQLMASQAALLMDDQTSLARHLTHGLDLLEQYGSGQAGELVPLQTLLRQLLARDWQTHAPVLGQAEERLRLLLRHLSDEEAA